MKQNMEFARVETDFVLFDPRFRGLPTAAKWIYLGVWCIAVKERSEVLPEQFDDKAIADLLHVDSRTMTRSLQALAAKMLVNKDEKGRLVVPGCRAKHQKLEWGKDTNWGGYRGDIHGEKEKRREEKSIHTSELENPNSEDRQAVKPKRRKGRPVATEYTPEFLTFCAVYPYRENNPKAGAFACWKRLVAKGVETDALIRAGTNYARYRQGQESRYTLEAQTFLGPRGHWEEFASADWKPLTATGGPVQPPEWRGVPYKPAEALWAPDRGSDFAELWGMIQDPQTSYEDFVARHKELLFTWDKYRDASWQEYRTRKGMET